MPPSSISRGLAVQAPGSRSPPTLRQHPAALGQAGAAKGKSDGSEASDAFKQRRNRFWDNTLQSCNLWSPGSTARSTGRDAVRPGRNLPCSFDDHRTPAGLRSLVAAVNSVMPGTVGEHAPPGLGDAPERYEHTEGDSDATPMLRTRPQPVPPRISSAFSANHPAGPRPVVRRGCMGENALPAKQQQPQCFSPVARIEARACAPFGKHTEIPLQTPSCASDFLLRLGIIDDPTRDRYTDYFLRRWSGRRR